MTQLSQPEMVKKAREIMGWSPQGWGDMFGVEEDEVRAWEIGEAPLEELVVIIAEFVLECEPRADLLHEIFDVPSLDEDGVLTLLGYLRDAIASGDGRLDEDLGESLQKAINMVLELSILNKDPIVPADAPEDAPEAWDV
jgi:hypothetical protein